MRRLASILVLACLFSGCLGGRSLDPRTARFPAPEFTPPMPAEAKLSGGARAFLLEDHDVPLVRVYLAFRGGSLYDPPGKAGLSDVVELAWRTGGAGDLSPEAVDEALESRGITLSLSIGRETGWVSLSVLPGDLEEGLDLLAQLVHSPGFRPDRVEWAATQVVERLRREDDDPQSLAFREMRRVLYRGHPRGVIPTAETVRRVERADAVAFHRRLVDESSWLLGTVGDFEARSLLPELEARFGALPGWGDGFPPVAPPSEPEPQTVLVPKDLPQNTIVRARLGPGRADPRFYAVDVLDQAVGSGGFQARLVREIRSNRGLAYSVGGFYQALPEFGVLGAYASTRTEATGQVLELMGEILEGVARGGLEPEELEQAKSALINRHVFRYEDPASTVRERMDLLLKGLPPDLPAQYPSRILEVTTEETTREARAHYGTGPWITVVVGAVDPQAPFWTKGPPVRVMASP